MNVSFRKHSDIILDQNETSKIVGTLCVLTKIRPSERSPLNSIFAFLIKDNSMFRLIADCTFSKDVIT